MSLKQRHILADQQAALAQQQDKQSLAATEVVAALSRAQRPISFNHKDLERVGLVDSRKLSADGKRLDSMQDGAQKCSPENVAAALAAAQFPLSTGDRLNGRLMAEDGRKLDRIEEEAQRVTPAHVLRALADAHGELAALLTEIAGRDIREDTGRLRRVEAELIGVCGHIREAQTAVGEIGNQIDALERQIAETGAEPCTAANIARSAKLIAELETGGAVNSRDMRKDGQKLDRVEPEAQRCSSGNVLAALAANVAPVSFNGADLTQIGSINGRSVEDLFRRLAALEAAAQ